MVKKRHWKTLTILGILVLILAGIELFLLDPLQKVNTPLTSLEEKPDIYTLDNGLTLTVKEAHTLPLTTIQFWIKTGSRNEPAGRNGISHIFEHIWFKGTATQPVGSFHKKVESLGGELNAMTSHDWTMYYVTVPSDKFDDIFPNMADLLLNPLFDEKEISKELQVVTEEQRFSYNEPERFLDDQYGLLLIDNHPYRNPIIGYKETILSTTRQQIMDYYKTWYVPNNMNIVIAGDVNKQEVYDKISSAFKDFKPREIPIVELPKEQVITVPKYNSGTKNIGYTYIATGFVGPSAQDKDKYSMLVLNTIFSIGDASRLQQIMKTQKNLITRGTSVYIPLLDMGVFETIINVEPEKTGQAKMELILQLNRFKTELVTDEELERAKMNIRADKVRSQEEIFQVGYDIGLSWIQGDEYEKFMTNINAVTKEDVKKVANKYFNAYTMYELKPKL